MAEQALSSYTYSDYLELEANSEEKYEFHGGYITAMAGGTLAHGQISVNVTTALRNSLEGAKKPCITYSSDVKVHVTASHRTYYPDGSVVYDTPEISSKDKHALINPILIVEVLSESMVAFDRGNKFAHYRKIPSLREYVLVSQSEPIVDTYYRLDSGAWEIQTIEGLSEWVTLKSLGIQLAMNSIYYLVEGMEEYKG